MKCFSGTQTTNARNREMGTRQGIDILPGAYHHPADRVGSETISAPQVAEALHYWAPGEVKCGNLDTASQHSTTMLGWRWEMAYPSVWEPVHLSAWELAYWSA